MILKETQIPDITKKNISQSKEIIADSIISNVYPLFDEVYQGKLGQVGELKSKLRSGTSQIKNEKETMEQLMEAYKKEKQISKVLDRIEKLVSAGLIYDGSLKHEMVILLKIVEKLPKEKLDQQLSKTVQILSKRFAK